MPSSWSVSLRFELQFTGENINLWGDKLNADLQHVDYAIAGWLNKTITGDYALTTANAGDDEARAAMIKFNGSLALNATITIPSVSKAYLVWNNTGKSLTFTTGAGATVVVDTSDIVNIACDGANVKTPGYAGLSLKDFIAASVLAATGTLPALTGNAGKYLYTDGVNALWRQPSTTDLSDYQSKVLGVQVALAVAL
jgi:hypothetical protein